MDGLVLNIPKTLPPQISKYQTRSRIRVVLSLVKGKRKVTDAMTSSNTIPTAATEGFKDASAYDAHRPSYPAEAVETLLKNLKVKGQSDYRIVEIASGTGKFTELLAKRPEQFLIKAVEPHDTMRQKLIEKNLPAVEVMDGTATQIPVDEEWADACIAAQVRCAKLRQRPTL